MSLNRVVETCSCGAKLMFSTSESEMWARKAAAAFRTDHQHERPDRLTGRCTEQIPAIDDGPPTTCSLSQGHMGAHHDDDTGADWWRKTPTTHSPDPEENR